MTTTSEKVTSGFLGAMILSVLLLGFGAACITYGRAQAYKAVHEVLCQDAGVEDTHPHICEKIARKDLI